MNPEETENKFIQNFILKHRKERSLWALRHKKKRTDFLDKFSQNWTDMIVPKKMIELISKSDEETYEIIKQKLKLKDSELFYVISYFELDGKFIDLQTAFEYIQSTGYAGLLVSVDGTKYYFKTEQELGSPKKFIGRI